MSFNYKKLLKNLVEIIQLYSLPKLNCERFTLCVLSKYTILLLCRNSLEN